MTGAKVAELEARIAALEAGYDAYAWQIGGILSVLTLGIIVFGFASFGYFRHVAGKEARDHAGATAKKVAEHEANTYVQSNLPSILAAYKDVRHQAFEDESDDIAAHAEDRLKT